MERVGSVFGPSETWLSKFGRGHHRSFPFHRLLSETERLFKERFDISDDWIVLFVTGSGTLANEIVLDSFGPIWVEGRGEFADRLRQLQGRPWADAGSPDPGNRFAIWTKPRCGRPLEEATAIVHYETYESRLNPPDALKDKKIAIEDNVSGFPYYLPYPQSNVWTTVAFKQLCGSCGLSIVVIRKDLLELTKPASPFGSTLNLLSYVEAREKKETPHTPAAEALGQLHMTLEGFPNLGEWRDAIDKRRKLIVEAVKPENVIGEGPVVTVQPGVLPEWFVQKWGLYIGRAGPQMFLHDENAIQDHVLFLKELWSCRS